MSPCQCSGPKLILGQPNLSIAKYQNQNITSPDIKKSVFLKSSLGTWWFINVTAYHQSTSSIKPEMPKKGKKGKEESTKIWKSPG